MPCSLPHCFRPRSYVNTTACKSAVSYIDGDRGILRYRGYPIEQLAERSNFLEVRSSSSSSSGSSSGSRSRSRSGAVDYSDTTVHCACCTGRSCREAAGMPADRLRQCPHHA